MVIDQWYFIGDQVIETIGDDGDDRTVNETEVAEIYDNGNMMTATGNTYNKYGLRTDPKNPWRSIRKKKIGD